MRIALASDHAGFALKDELAAWLRDSGHVVLDLGTNSPDSVDYPEFGARLANAVASGDAERGIAVCGSGIGISIAVNRNPKCRCARVDEPLSAALARERVEQFRVLFLDSKNRLIADEAQARGTVNHTPVYPREVVRRALEVQATALILVHNHPSGDPSPSRADIEMTQEIKAAAGTLGIVVHDHLIVGNGRHLSFRREGLL